MAKAIAIPTAQIAQIGHPVPPLKPRTAPITMQMPRIRMLLTKGFITRLSYKDLRVLKA
jgi:hypothetical protein